VKLHSYGQAQNVGQSIIGKVITNTPDLSFRRDSILFWSKETPPPGTTDYLAIVTPTKSPFMVRERPASSFSPES
jgi:hypothetical protein